MRSEGSCSLKYFGENIRRLRLKRNLTLEKTAEELQISPELLAKLESLETTEEHLPELSFEALIHASNFFDVSPDILLGKGPER